MMHLSSPVASSESAVNHILGSFPYLYCVLTSTYMKNRIFYYYGLQDGRIKLLDCVAYALAVEIYL